MHIASPGSYAFDVLSQPESSSTVKRRYQALKRRRGKTPRD